MTAQYHKAQRNIWFMICWKFYILKRNIFYKVSVHIALCQNMNQVSVLYMVSNYFMKWFISALMGQTLLWHIIEIKQKWSRIDVVNQKCIPNVLSSLNLINFWPIDHFMIMMDLYHYLKEITEIINNNNDFELFI